MTTTRGRLVHANQTVQDQADFFAADGYTRVTDLTITNIEAALFFNNTLLTWPLVSGVGVSDTQVTSGKVYWQEIQPGYYGVRFRPNAIGYWRLLIDYPAGTQKLAQDYDVVAGGAATASGCEAGGSGLRATFVKPGDR